ncbi:ROK family glucokinase [Terribacillus saccharophilus]|uniref:Glucokinase n=1 Tax=Terribacillus saccharophilus TaxID=361277 RepID=A0ABX4H2C3_9BACI|nr:ROK family glucokinase [Terribacillus saccharophilus]PAD36910.1 glucokinase [Terribacillus saccharophilus]PAD97893.1 glucokinase [Terribacillus saccharophilus]PAE01275.1 glucokinase [Terribacillus saccharophilus]
MSKDGLLVGVDIGGTTIKLAIIDETSEIVEKWEIKTDKYEQGLHIPKQIWETIQAKLKERDIAKERIQGIGVGAPGFVVPSNGVIAEAVNVGWRDFPLSAELGVLSGLPVFIDNDANLAALGEVWKGAGAQQGNIIAITLGTGVGAGIIANGHIVNGINGTAGEIGHVTVEENGAPCNCGRKGCLETISSATGISRLATEAATVHPESGLGQRFAENGRVSSKDVFELAAENDAVAQKIVDRATSILAKTLANAAILTNPSRIIIGGGVSKAGDALMKPIKEAFKKNALPRTTYECEIVLAQLGNDAGVYGAAYLVKQHLEESVN